MANNLGSLAKTILSSDALSAIAKQTNVSSDAVSEILSNALPALLNGANQQATQKSTAESFLEAIQSHGSNDTSNIGSFLKNVDIDDGAKIVKHLLGSNSDTLTKKVAKTSKSGIKAGDVAKVLAVAAPLIMSFLGKQAKGKKNDNPLSAITGLLGGNEITNLASSLLGGNSKKDDGIDLGDVLNIAGKLLKK